MKKTMSRLLAMLLAVGMVFSVTACSGDGGTSSGSGDSSSGTTSTSGGDSEDYDPFGKYDEEVKMTAATPISATGAETDFKDNVWVKKYKEVYNLAIDYVFLAPQEQYDQRIAIMMTDASQLPDCFTTSLIQTQQLIDAGLLEPQTAAWANYASDQAKEAMMQNGSAPFDVVTSDGELYAMPWVQPAIETVHALFVNEKWRKDLGLPEPDTLENFEKMIYGFKEKDPNGNGKADEYGIGLSKNLWDLGFEAYSFCNIFGAYPDSWLKDDDGKVFYGSVQEEMKPALEKLAQYYKDGLIDPEFIVKSYEEEAELVTKEQLGAMFGIQWTGLMGTCLQSLYKNYDADGKDPDSLEWKVYALPSLDGTTETTPIIYDNTSKFVVVKAGYEHPEAVTKMVNYIHFMGMGPDQEAGPEGHPELGISYEEYNGIAEDGTDTTNGLWDAWGNNLFAAETIHANVDRWTNWFKIINDDDAAAKEWCEKNYLARSGATNIQNFAKDGKDMVNANGVKGIDSPSWQFVYNTCGATFMYGLEEQEKGNIIMDVRGAFVSDTMVDRQASLESLELQEITKIITGESSIDAFDTFVQNWKANGGDTITQEMQEYIDSLS
ncbi:MAG: hypothetical protein ACLU62_01195 [Hydrogeniiclostridium sp.]